MLYGVADYTALLLQWMIVARLLYDVLRSHDYEGAKCYTTRLFIGSQGSLPKLLITSIFFFALFSVSVFFVVVIFQDYSSLLRKGH